MKNASKKSQQSEKPLEEVLREEPAPPAVVVNSWDEADLRLLELGRIRHERAALQAEANGKKAAIAAEYDERLKDFDRRDSAIEFAVKAFAAKRGDEIPRGSKKELNYGAIAKSQKSTVVEVLLKNLEAVAAKLLKSAKYRHFVTRPDPTVSKTDLKKIPEKEQKKFGFVVKETEPTYSIDLNEQRIRSFVDRRGGEA